MSFDPAGTAPGLQPQVEAPPKVHWKCRNPTCDSMLAIEVKLPNQPGRHLYQCCACKMTMGINTGGSFDIG